MILGEKHIIEMLNNGIIEHAEMDQVNPASINLRLGNSFLTHDNERLPCFALGDKVEYREMRPYNGGNGNTFRLPAHGFCLATTMERINLPADMAAFVQGRSSIGRAGLSVQNAGFVDPGFYGHITLELKNETDCDILLTPGYRVAQLVFMKADGVIHPYNGKYNGQIEATGSRMNLDIKKQ